MKELISPFSWFTYWYRILCSYIFSVPIKIYYLSQLLLFIKKLRQTASGMATELIHCHWNSKAHSSLYKKYLAIKPCYSLFIVLRAAGLQYKSISIVADQCDEVVGHILCRKNVKPMLCNYNEGRNLFI